MPSWDSPTCSLPRKTSRKKRKKEFASIIDNNTRLLLKLVNDVLELSRIESGNMSFHCEDCSAHHFAETVYQTHQVIILPPVEFIKEFPDEDVTIHIDRMRLTQVITNFWETPRSSPPKDTSNWVISATKRKRKSISS